MAEPTEAGERERPDAVRCSNCRFNMSLDEAGEPCPLPNCDGAGVALYTLERAADLLRTEPGGEAEKHLRRAAEIIETGDQRLLAHDGDAGGQPPDISLAEWRELYRCIVRAQESRPTTPVEPEET